MSFSPQNHCNTDLPLLASNAPAKTHALTESLSILEDALTVVKHIEDDEGIMKEAAAYNKHMLKAELANDIASNMRNSELRRIQKRNSLLKSDEKFSRRQQRYQTQSAKKCSIVANAPLFQCSAFCPFGKLLMHTQAGQVFVAVFANSYLVTFDSAGLSKLEIRDIEVLDTTTLVCVCAQQPSHTAEQANRDMDASLDIFTVDSNGLASLYNVTLKSCERRAYQHIRQISLSNQQPLFRNKVTACAYLTAAHCIVVMERSIIFLVHPETLAIQKKIDLMFTLRFADDNSLGVHIMCMCVSSNTLQIVVALQNGSIVLFKSTECSVTLLAQYKRFEAPDFKQTLANEYTNNDDESDSDNSDVSMSLYGVDKLMTSHDVKPMVHSEANHNQNNEICSENSSSNISSIAVLCDEYEGNVILVVTGCNDGTTRLHHVPNDTAKMDTASILCASSDKILLDISPYQTDANLAAIRGVCVIPHTRFVTTIDAHNTLKVWSLDTMEVRGVTKLDGFPSILASSSIESSSRIVLSSEDQISLWIPEGRFYKCERDNISTTNETHSKNTIIEDEDKTVDNHYNSDNELI